jgi:uncharacterized protein (TIGR02246 family)
MLRSVKYRLAVVLAAGALFGGLTASGRLSGTGRAPDEPGATGRPEDKDVKGRRAAFIAAFNKGDAKAVAAFYAPDATYVDEEGREYNGRAAVEQLYEKTFAAHKGAKLAIHPTASKMLSPDVALNDGVTEVTPAGGGLPTATRFSAVLVKKEGEWYLQSVHEAEARPPSNAAHLEDLEWLIGEWKGEADKGESATASYDWAENQNFIVSSYDTTLDGVPVAGGTQWIGYDAVDKQVRSWSFYSGGGFGEAVWTKDGNRWVINTTARTADGKRVSATNIITKTDDDHLTWQMTKLTVNGESLPDLQPVKMKRVEQAGGE